MGVIHPISSYVNSTLKEIIKGEKSDKFASSKEQRAIRYVQAFNSNSELLGKMMYLCKKAQSLTEFHSQPPEPGWDQ